MQTRPEAGFHLGLPRRTEGLTTDYTWDSGTGRLTSMSQATVPNPGGSQGNLCLGGSIGRYVGPGQIKNSGATGSFQLTLDLGQHPTPSGFVQVTAGQTWNFTCWHRDVAGGVATSTVADAVSITFQ